MVYLGKKLAQVFKCTMTYTSYTVYTVNFSERTLQGCPDRGSGAKFGSLAKFIWLLCVLFCVMHFGSGGLKEYNASTLELDG